MRAPPRGLTDFDSAVKVAGTLIRGDCGGPQSTFHGSRAQISAYDIHVRRTQDDSPCWNNVTRADPAAFVGFPLGPIAYYIISATRG